jgi:hypothetical protein
MWMAKGNSSVYKQEIRRLVRKAINTIRPTNESELRGFVRGRTFGHYLAKPSESTPQGRTGERESPPGAVAF